MKPLITLLVLLAIGSISYGEPTTGAQEDQSLPPLVVPEILHTASVGATLSSDQPEYLAGKPVNLTFIVTNHSKASADYEFNNGQLYDIVISDATGKIVWRWSQNKVFPQLMSHLNLATNESATYNVQWLQRDNDDHPLPAGTYSVLAQLIPMARPEVTGNLLANTNNDPVNTGMPTNGPIESGAINVKNTTPIVYAKTTIKIDGSS
jgi:hypothetical protein